MKHVHIDQILAKQNKKISFFVDSLNSRLSDAIDIKFPFYIFSIDVKKLISQFWLKCIKRK